MYSFDCPVCIAYLEDLDICDCGCGEYRCPMCNVAFSFEDTEINQLLYRNGIYSDVVAVSVDADGDRVMSPAFRDADMYKRFVEWNALRMSAAVDQLDAMLTDDSGDEQ